MPHNFSQYLQSKRIPENLA
jgi:hypothetical protein